MLVSTLLFITTTRFSFLLSKVKTRSATQAYQRAKLFQPKHFDNDRQRLEFVYLTQKEHASSELVEYKRGPRAKVKRCHR